MTTRKRRTFDPSLKLEVVRMIKEQGLSVQNVQRKHEHRPDRDPACMPAKLVCDALNMAIQQRQPAPGLIVHSSNMASCAA